MPLGVTSAEALLGCWPMLIQEGGPDPHLERNNQGLRVSWDACWVSSYFSVPGCGQRWCQAQGLLSLIKALAQCSFCYSSESWMDHTIQAMLSPPKLLGAPSPQDGRLVGYFSCLGP